MYVRKLTGQVILDYGQAEVMTDKGMLRGVISDGTYIFRGIKYAVADRFRDSFGDDVMIATGMNFPDALAGGVLAAKLDTPLLLTHDMGMIDEMKAYVDERTPDNIYVLGGEGAVPSLVPAELYH